MDGKNVYPPPTNRGVQNTSTDTHIALVDWVAVTFPIGGGSLENLANYTTKTIEKTDDGDRVKVVHDLGLYTAHKVIELLEISQGEFKEMPHGINGYKKQLKRGHIVVLYDGTNDMGVHLIMSGQGCREFEAEYKKGWKEFFAKVFWEKAHFTRLDLAIDDFKGYLKPEQIIWRLDNGLASSRFKDYRYMKKGRISDGSNKGMTIYFGSASSDIQIRIYDKLKERLSAGKEVSEDVKHWVRTEIELKDKRADMAASQIIYEGAIGSTNIGVVIAGILKNYVTFFEKKTEDKNKSRWPKWKRWEKFLGDSAKLKLTLVAPDRTIGTRQAWIDKQTSKTLGMLFLAYDSDIEFLVDAVNRGMELLEPKDVLEIETYKRNQILLDQYLKEARRKEEKVDEFSAFSDYLDSKQVEKNEFYSFKDYLRELDKKRELPHLDDSSNTHNN